MSEGTCEAAAQVAILKVWKYKLFLCFNKLKIDYNMPVQPRSSDLSGVIKENGKIVLKSRVSICSPKSGKVFLDYAASVVMFLGLTITATGTSSAEQIDPSFACLSHAGPVQVVDGFFRDEFEPSAEANKKFDARTASFEYPETISHSMVSLGEKGGSGADDMCWAGGFFTASLSWHGLDISWQESKDGADGDGGEMENTTSVTSYENRITWTGLHVYNMHDGMRTNNTYNHWTIRHVWLDYIRDDCVENDSNYSGTLYDVLFDGCYTGISNQSGDGTGETIVMDKVLLRMEPMPYPYKWDTKDDPVVYLDGYGDVPFGHGSVFKGDEGSFPQFSITDSVFLHEYDAEETIFPPASKVTTCENNTIIWLDGPATAPIHLEDEFPGCFTIITDYAEGKAFWAEKVADWHNRHPEVGRERKPADPGEYSWPRYGISDSEPTNGTPTANFSTSCIDLDCSFTDTSSDSDGIVTAWAWDFGDGSSSSVQNPSHTYAAAGSYTVSLTVTDDDGDASAPADMNISVTAPAAEPAISGLTTDGGNTTMVAGTTETVAVSGAGFDSNASLSFLGGSGPTPTASAVSVSEDGTLLTVDATAKSGGPPRDRLWDVQVTNPDGSSAVLAAGLTVTP